MKDYRKIIFVLAVVVFIITLFVVSRDANSEEEIPKPTVALSTFAMYDIAKHISQDTFELFMILPEGADAHTYKPTQQIVTKIENSDLFIYNGAGLETWVGNIKFKNRVVDMSKYVKLRELEPNEHHIHAHHDEQCAHNKIDPHYWLDFENMIKATKLISGELIRITPQNKDLYIKNRDKYIAMLNRLDRLYKKELNSCYLDTIVVNHNAFSYLLRNYNLSLKSLKGLSSDIELSSKDVKRVSDDTKNIKIRTLFYEDFVANEEIKSLAKELNIRSESLNPLANITKDELKQNLTYEKVMKTNLIKISKALMCK